MYLRAKKVVKPDFTIRLVRNPNKVEKLDKMEFEIKAFSILLSLLETLKAI